MACQRGTGEVGGCGCSLLCTHHEQLERRMRLLHHAKHGAHCGLGLALVGHGERSLQRSETGAHVGGQ